MMQNLLGSVIITFSYEHVVKCMLITWASIKFNLKYNAPLTFWLSLYFKQVTMSDQAVIEGQEVTMSVRISGQPKPMLYW